MFILSCRHHARSERTDNSSEQVRPVFHASAAQVFICPRMTSAFRAALLSIVIAGILPMINSVGVAVTGIISGLLAWAGFGCVEIFQYNDLTLSY